MTRMERIADSTLSKEWREPQNDPLAKAVLAAGLAVALFLILYLVVTTIGGREEAVRHCIEAGYNPAICKI